MTTTLPHLPLFPGFVGTTNPALIAAVGSLADYDQHQTARDVLERATAAANEDMLSAVEARMTLVAQVNEKARAGKPLPASLGRSAADVTTKLTAAQATLSVLTEAGQELAQSRDQILAAAPDALMRHLDGQLQAALQEARALQLGEVRSPQAAIDAGLVDQWRRYLELTETHAQLRTAQRMVAAHLIGGDSTAAHLPTFGTVRNYAELFPTWLDRQRRIPTGTVNGEPVYSTPPWTEDDPDNVWSFAVAHDEVVLWVPTGKQMHDAYADALTVAREVENARAREEQGAQLTPDQRDRLNQHRSLERLYLTPEGVLR